MSAPTSLGQAAPIRETDRALLVQIEDMDDPVWVPKSCIDEDSECYSMASGEGELLVHSWWAEKNLGSR